MEANIIKKNSNFKWDMNDRKHDHDMGFCRTIELSVYRAVGLSSCRTIQRSYYRAVGLAIGSP